MGAPWFWGPVGLHCSTPLRAGPGGSTAQEQEGRPAATEAVRGGSRELQEDGDGRNQREDGRRRPATERGGGKKGGAAVLEV